LFLCWRAGRFSVFAFKLPLSTGFVVRLGSLLGVLPASVAVRASQQIGFALHSLKDLLFLLCVCQFVQQKRITSCGSYIWLTRDSFFRTSFLPSSS
jgi:hypothetical protein